MSWHPYSQATAHAALANLEEAIETARASTRARTVGGAQTLADRAVTQMVNAAAKLRDALTLEEMATTTGQEAGE